MKKLLLIFLFLMTLISVKASHIVGGEFELTWINGNTYRLRLIYYFDVASNPGRNPTEEEPTIEVRIFQKSNGLSIRDVTLGDAIQERVEYTQLSCASSELVTDRIVYSALIQLEASVFNHPQGYYIAWERCCRNYSITNIFSEPQPGTGIFAGQTFYLEFPPVVKNGQPFINNSPRLFPPLSDFACPQIPYYVDFAGVDDDGDSLTYSLVTPFNTFTNDAVPPGGTRPGPYPEVTWRPGFGLENILNGVTNLTISQEGFLNVTPNTTGLYVFAVKCEEFRDGVKIGEIIRDFQMLVVELGSCPTPNYPSIVGKGPNDSGFGTTGTLSVSYANTVPISDRCFEVKISDPSTLRPDENNQENIKIKAIALDFKRNISEVLPTVTAAFIENGEEAFFEICFPNVCPYKEGGTFQIGIVASDDACALPLTDTLRVTVYIEPPPNQAPQFDNPGGLTNITATIQEGDPLQTWPLRAFDSDGDVLTYRLVPVGFVLSDAGMSFNGALSGQQASPLAS